jgi:hypothetical protein
MKLARSNATASYGIVKIDIEVQYNSTGIRMSGSGQYIPG